MSRSVKSIFELRYVPSAHIFSCLLLASIIYGATFQVVHQHGAPALRQVPSASNTLDAISPSDGADSSSEGTLKSKDCSICQLHRQLASTLLYGAVPALATPARYTPPADNSIPAHSANRTPQRGRAPPTISL